MITNDFLAQNVILRTVDVICTPIFSIFLKRVVGIVISEFGQVSNESCGDFTFNSVIQGFLKIHS